MDPATHEWFDVAAAADIAEGHVHTYVVGAQRVAVARADGALFAVQDRCSHDDGELGSGCLVGYSVQCPRHGARFDIRDGHVTAAPAVVGIGTFEVREMNGRVEVAGVPATQDEDDW